MGGLRWHVFASRFSSASSSVELWVHASPRPLCKHWCLVQAHVPLAIPCILSERRHRTQVQAPGTSQENTRKPTRLMQNLVVHTNLAAKHIRHMRAPARCSSASTMRLRGRHMQSTTPHESRFLHLCRGVNHMLTRNFHVQVQFVSPSAALKPALPVRGVPLCASPGKSANTDKCKLSVKERT